MMAAMATMEGCSVEAKSVVRSLSAMVDGGLCSLEATGSTTKHSVAQIPSTRPQQAC